MTFPIALRHGLALALLILAGCASAPRGERVILLESDGYACGAAPVGCGLALAPVLETIDGIDGVAGSSVSWDGRRFRIELQSGADEERVIAQVESVLEGNARRCEAYLGPGEGAPAAGAAASSSWWNAGRTVEFSRFEAGVMASDYAADIAAEAHLDDADRRQLETILREELVRAFERAHAAGGGVHRLWEQLPQARSDFDQRLGFLTPEQRTQVAAVVDREFPE